MSIIIAAGPVLVEGRAVLLNKHGDTSFWKFCGGRLEQFDQSLKEGCRREVKEEMGIELEFLSDEPYLFYTKKDTAAGQFDIILVHYLARRIGEIVLGADIREWTWLPFDRLDDDELAPNIKPVLKHFGLLA